MKVRLELDVHPSEATRVASLVSALRDFVAVLSTYSASPEEHINLNNASPGDLTPSPTSALSVESSDPDPDIALTAPVPPSHPTSTDTPSGAGSAPSPRAPPRQPPRTSSPSPSAAGKNAANQEPSSSYQPSMPSPHASDLTDVSHGEPSDKQSAQTNPNPSISVELEGLISADMAATAKPTASPSEPITSSSDTDPLLAPEDAPPPLKQTPSRPKHAGRESKPRNGNRSNSRKTTASDSTSQTSTANRKPRSASRNPDGTRSRIDDASSSTNPRRVRRNPRVPNVKNSRPPPSTLNEATSSAEISGNTMPSSRQNGRKRPHIVPIITPQGLFEAVAVAGISVKRAVSDLQGMLSRKTNQISQEEVVDAAIAELVDPAKVCNHPSRGLNIIKVFNGLGEKHLGAFRRNFATQAIKQFVKSRDPGCDRAVFLGYSDGLSALVQENCISADAALKTIWRLLLSEGCWSAAVTTLCKLAESCNGTLAQKCVDHELLDKVKGKLTELANKNEFVYDITYLNGVMNWTIPVPQ